ncbi:MAG: aminopeptidase [Candidatus Diapherotrites archaeon]|jgi:hypothetical protein|uniref:Aminopeptidase n=1 Tax=Candidatus Iainarchaeum sp. TaxID=3101447 RepID=A0A7K4BYQ3_9ARCH|nr:aminopeptidase [Candidatus Diapherotrites archaeon]
MIQIDEIKKLEKVKIISLPALKKVFRLYEITPSSNILIWTDSGKTIAPRIAKTIYLELKKMGCGVSLIVDPPRTNIAPAPKKTINAILSLSKNEIFISVGSGNRGHIVVNGKQVLMRNLMKKNGFRMVSLGGLGSLNPKKVNNFLTAFDHNEKEVKELNEKIKNLMKVTKKIKITCPIGSNLELSFDSSREVICNDANWRAYSTNYPVGEVYVAPIEDSANGVIFVSSAKISGKTIVPKKPIKFIFKNGLLVKTNSKKINDNLIYVEKVNKLKKISDYKNKVRTIAEFAIGTNRKASIVGAMICDEKTLGTIHFAIGNNKHLGGNNYCNGHFDNVVTKPTVYFDDKKIMEKGKLLL